MVSEARPRVPLAEVRVDFTVLDAVLTADLARGVVHRPFLHPGMRLDVGESGQLRNGQTLVLRSCRIRRPVEPRSRTLRWSQTERALRGILDSLNWTTTFGS